MENTKEESKRAYSGNNRVENLSEKKIIVYLVIATLLLVFFSLFFIHYIVSRGTLKDTKSSTIIVPDNTNNPDNNNNNNNGNNGNNNNNNNNGNDQNIVDNSDRFRILEGTKEWSELKELNIFSDSNMKGNHVVKGKIAPGVSGTYNFTVENYGDSRLKYEISFAEDNPFNINIQYKIKINGQYVSGNDSTWVDYTELNQTNRTINAKSTDLYTIEWKWVDSSNDTEVGETEGAYYKLNVKAYAEMF